MALRPGNPAGVPLSAPFRGPSHDLGTRGSARIPPRPVQDKRAKRTTAIGSLPRMAWLPVMERREVPLVWI
ncbi:uncharacterized protein LOC111673914 isoform X2 [Orussus abietinus]|uniref:uncharacterized protein LOC111673914 isoform X2 n=1 Tax=Orussus abietinus TaxID=222816 RepID=UPI000C7160FB|nr:uncharacterized protein LOC111673914 isoform X2 [Orussus abietinus]